MSLRTWLCDLLACPAVAAPPGPPPSPNPLGPGPAIALVNLATVPLGVDWGQLVRALQQYVDQYVAPVWHTPAQLASTLSVPIDHWALLFLDDADAANALGYHDLTAAGLPLGKVFVTTTRAAGEQVSVTAAHELAEMLVDPSINLLATGSQRVQDVYAYEVCDAVEERPFLYVQGVPLSNFVWPTYFEDFHPPGQQYDQLDVLSAAFSLAPGGYASVLAGGTWGQVFGSAEKARRFAQEDRRQHRSELRAGRHAGTPLRRSMA